MTDPIQPAFYAVGGGAARQWWTLLHPPYTAWHLSYVVIGGCLASSVDWRVLGLTVLAFAAALGVGAHALDEWHGRPLQTNIPASALITAAVTSVAFACALGIVVASATTWWLLPTIAVGAALVPAYNLELIGGVIHNDAGFGLAWGAFPVITAALAQTGELTVAALCAACFATMLSLAQRRLSTAARWARRDLVAVEGIARSREGSSVVVDRSLLLDAPEGALRLLTASVVVLALCFVALRL